MSLKTPQLLLLRNPGFVFWVRLDRRDFQDGPTITPSYRMEVRLSMIVTSE
jgi:hypothetical protein